MRNENHAYNNNTTSNGWHTTSSFNLSAMRSLSICSASNPTSSSTSCRIFSRYRSASRNLRSAAVSPSYSDSLVSSSSLLALSSSSSSSSSSSPVSSLPDMDSSSSLFFDGGGRLEEVLPPLLVGRGDPFVVFFRLLLEALTAPSVAARLRLRAGAVKKDDISVCACVPWALLWRSFEKPFASVRCISPTLALGLTTAYVRW